MTPKQHDELKADFRPDNAAVVLVSYSVDVMGYKLATLDYDYLRGLADYCEEEVEMDSVSDVKDNTLTPN